MALRCSLVACSAVVARLVPSLSSLISIVGALFVPWIAVTIPALLDLCAGLSMRAYPMSSTDVFVAGFALVASFLFSIGGTVCIVLQLEDPGVL